MKDEPNEFSHPFEPYQIQLELMRAVYRVIDDGYKVGLIESPTGTGKTLSLICSTMTWLRKYKKTQSVGEQDEDEPLWVREAYQNSILSEKIQNAKKYESRLDQVEIDFTNFLAKDLPENQKFSKKIKLSSADDEFLAEDYHSQDEEESVNLSIKDRSTKLEDEVQLMMSKLEKVVETKSEDQEFPQIFFCSRTHSQLNQFSSQLTLTKFPPTYDNVAERTKYLPLGSRKQLCVHPRISKYRDASLINDACTDLQRDTTKSCSYYPNFRDEKTREVAAKFKDYSLSSIHDIEDLASIGRHLKICPYYSVRKSISSSEVLTLPYQLLLEKNTREALNLNIKDSIVVIDEAHNLLDTITAMNSSCVSLTELQKSHSAIRFYLSKFQSRLNGGNRINLSKLCKTIQLIMAFITERQKSRLKPGMEINASDFFQGTTGDLFNIHKLEKYLKVSKIAYKIEGYIEKQSGEKSKHSSTPLLFTVISFLRCLSNPSKAGKFFFDQEGGSLVIKYLLLDPSEVFKDIVEEARCVILAGGTMEPMGDYEKYLFPYLSQGKVLKFRCDHVIPDENLKVYGITTGFAGTQFDFSFQNRKSTEMLRDLGQSINSLLRAIKGGVVVFFPSYQYLEDVAEVWRTSGLYGEMSSLKKIFKEDRNSNSDDVLLEYTKCIRDSGGAVLLAVVGGKMSEGINFSDDLARAVLMVGLPFPNAFSGELVAKRKYIEQRTREAGGDDAAARKNATDFYENICMRSVNQSVGRAIRHKDDYAMIFLFDYRYQQERIQGKLSEWFRKRIAKQMDFQGILQSVKEFEQSHASC